jgi:hypothetical protein
VALPENLSYTYITGRFLRAVADTGDPDVFPDGIPITGLTITFTPDITPPRVKNATSVPPVTMNLEPITATTDAEGDVITVASAAKGVYLVSSDDPDLDPHGWTYKVKITGTGFTEITFSFIARSGETMDLTSMVPVPVNPGAAIALWEQVVDQAETARDDAQTAAAAAEQSATEAAASAAGAADAINAAATAETAADTATAAAVSASDSASAASINATSAATSASNASTSASAAAASESAAESAQTAAEAAQAAAEAAAAGGGGIHEYASVTELDSETETVLGIVPPTTSWGAYFGAATFNSYTGPALVRTIAGVRSGAPELTQTLNIGRHSGGYDIIYSRTKYSTAAWTSWTLGAAVPTPTQNYHATTKLYVDAKSLQYIEWTGLDSFTSNQGFTGLVNVTGSDLGALTGIPAYNGYPGSYLRFEQNGAYVNPDYNTVQIQRVWIPNPDGTLTEIRRFREDVPDYTMSAWSAWAIHSEGGGEVPADVMRYRGAWEVSPTDPYLVGNVVYYNSETYIFYGADASEVPGTGTNWQLISEPINSHTSSYAGVLVAGSGTFRLYNDSGHTRRIQKVRASVGVAPVGQAAIIDVNVDGTTIFTNQANRPTIAADAYTGVSPAPDVVAWPDGSYITFDIDQVGTTAAGGDLTVSVVVRG